MVRDGQSFGRAAQFARADVLPPCNSKPRMFSHQISSISAALRSRQSFTLPKHATGTAQRANLGRAVVVGDASPSCENHEPADGFSARRCRGFVRTDVPDDCETLSSTGEPRWVKKGPRDLEEVLRARSLVIPLNPSPRVYSRRRRAARQRNNRIAGPAQHLRELKRTKAWSDGWLPSSVTTSVDAARTSRSSSTSVAKARRTFRSGRQRLGRSPALRPARCRNAAAVSDRAFGLPVCAARPGNQDGAGLPISDRHEISPARGSRDREIRRHARRPQPRAEVYGQAVVEARGADPRGCRLYRSEWWATCRASPGKAMPEIPSLDMRLLWGVNRPGSDSSVIGILQGAE